MAKGFSIRAFLGLDTKQFTRGMKGARGKLTNFQKGLRGINDTLRGLKFAAIGVTAVGAFSRAVNTLKDFQTNMARVKVITEASEDTMLRMTEAARKIGAETRFSASEAASGLQFLGMAGLSAEESLQALPSTLDLAGAGMIGVGRSADIVTNVLAGFNLATSEAARVSDLFAQASRKSNQTVEELYEGIKLIAPAYNNLGLSIEEATTDMALLANSGIKAEQAGTALAGALSRLLRQPPLVAKALAELGVKVDENKIKQKGLIGVIQELRDAGINASQMTRILGLHWKTTGALISSTDEEIQKLAKSMNDATGAAGEMSENGIGGIDKAIKLLNSAIDELAISLGYDDGLNGLLEAIVTRARDVVVWFTKMSKGAKLFHIAMIGVIFKGQAVVRGIASMAAMIPKAVVALKTGTIATRAFGLAFKSALGPIGWVALAIEGLLLLMGEYKSDVDIIKERNEEVAKVVEDAQGKSIKEIQKAAKEQERIIEDTNNRLIELEKTYVKGKTSIRNKALAAEKGELEREKERRLGALRLLNAEINKIEWATAEEKRKIERKTAAEQEAYAEEQRLAAAESEKAFNKALSGRVTELKTLGEISEAVKVLKAARTNANISELSEIDAKIAKLKEYNDIFIKSSRAPLPELDKIKPLDAGVDGEPFKLSIDTTVLQNMDAVNNSLQETLNLFNSLQAATPYDAFIEKLEQSKIGASTLELGMVGLSESLMKVAETGADSFDELGSALANAAREAIRASIARGVAGALASSFESLPFPLNIIGAPVAAAAASTAFNSLIPAFATGGIQGIPNGIVPGTSLTGDNNLARVNSREAVLTLSDQKNLFHMIRNGNGVSNGRVEFEVKGDKLVGVLNNTKTKNRRF